MKHVIITASILASLLWLPACASSTRDNAGRVSEEVANDAFGLPRQRPGEIVLPSEHASVATPYGGGGARRTCRNAAADIAQITLLMGADTELPRQAGETEQSRLARARQFTSYVRQSTPGAAADAARSAVVGLNPARPVVRFVGQAGRIESEARLERQLLMKQRAWLRGAFDAWGCDHRVMVRAFDQAGIRLVGEGLVAED